MDVLLNAREALGWLPHALMLGAGVIVAFLIAVTTMVLRVLRATHDTHLPEEN